MKSWGIGDIVSLPNRVDFHPDACASERIVLVTGLL